MKYKTIIFDLDGTLLDTISDLTNSLNQAYNDLGYKSSFTDNDIKKLVGGGSRNLIDRSAASFNLSEDEKEKIFIRYSEIYSKNCLVLTKPFDEVEDTLIKLKNEGLKLGVISNKPDRNVQSCVNHYFKGIFDFVSGKIDGIAPKPERAVFDHLAKLYNFDSSSTLYVGDMIYDIMFAKNCNVDVAICSFGFGKIEELKDYTYLLDKMSDLMKVIK